MCSQPLSTALKAGSKPSRIRDEIQSCGLDVAREGAHRASSRLRVSSTNPSTFPVICPTNGSSLPSVIPTELLAYLHPDPVALQELQEMLEEGA